MDIYILYMETYTVTWKLDNFKREAIKKAIKMVVISYMKHMNKAYTAMILFSLNVLYIRRLRTAYSKLPSHTKISLKTVLSSSDTVILY